jgi:hypothetical protein
MVKGPLMPGKTCRAVGKIARKSAQLEKTLLANQ